jgi:hypothetical protein
MSKGPGRVMRAVADAIEAVPVLTIVELCRAAYPAASRIEKKHRVAVIRAVRTLARDRSDLRIDPGYHGAHGGLILYRAAPDYQRKGPLDIIPCRGEPDFISRSDYALIGS